MQRVSQIPNATSTYNSSNQRIYTRFHRKPQIYPTSFQKNKKDQINTLEEENVNSLITDIYKQKKYRGMYDPASPNNKNIFIDTDSEVPKSGEIPEEFQNTHIKKSTQLLIAKTESQFPETYNAQNVFKRDGLIKGYYVKVNPNRAYNNNYNTYDYLKNGGNRNTGVKTVFQTPEPEYDENMIYDYNQGYQTQIKPKNDELDYFDYNDNSNLRKNEIGEEYYSLQNNPNNNIYFRNKDIQMNIKPIKNNINNNQQYNEGIFYKKNNMSNSKSNASDLSIDINQQKRQQNGNNIINNFIIKGTG